MRINESLTVVTRQGRKYQKREANQEPTVSRLQLAHVNPGGTYNSTKYTIPYRTFETVGQSQLTTGHFFQKVVDCSSSTFNKRIHHEITLVTSMSLYA
jgi:hypothetical protein